MHECSCGFTAGTAIAFQKHLSKADLLEDHRLIQDEGKQPRRGRNSKPPSLRASGTSQAVAKGEQHISESTSKVSGELLHTPSPSVHSTVADLNYAWESVAVWTADVDSTPLHKWGIETATPGSPARHEGDSASPPLPYAESPPTRPNTNARNSRLPPLPTPENSIARWSGAFMRTIAGASRRLSSYGQELQRTPSASEVIQRQSMDGSDWATATSPGQQEDALALVDSMEGLLLWRDAWHTTKVFGGGLYLLICVQQLSSGFGVVQPTTLLCGAALLYMLLNFLREAWRRRREGSQQQQQQLSPPPKSIREQEVELVQQVTLGVANLAGILAPYCASATVLVWRRLAGRRFRSTFWLALLLYLFAVVGEWRLLGQGSMLILAWLLLFSFPWLYVQCKRAMDAMVEEALAAAVHLLSRGNRVSLLLALGSSLVVLTWAPLAFMSRLSVALCSGLAVLVWHSSITAAAPS